MSKNVERKDYERDGSLIRESVPDDFADVMGAMFLMGWNYNYETFVREDDGAVVADFYGFRVDSEGGPDPKSRAVTMRWVYTNSAWDLDKDQTGLVNDKAKSAKRIQPHGIDYLIGYIGKNVNDWEWATTFDAGDVDVSEEEIDLGDEPAPKRSRGGRKAKDATGEQLAIGA